jgi:hypothetical protein
MVARMFCLEAPPVPLNAPPKPEKLDLPILRFGLLFGSVGARDKLEKLLGNSGDPGPRSK